MNRKQRRAIESGNARISGAKTGKNANIQQLVMSGVTHHQAGRLAEAEVLYTRAIEASPQNADALYLRGSLFYQTGRCDAAVNELNRAVQLNPKNSNALNNLGLALQEQGKQTEAIERYTEALCITPDFPAALYNIGSALQQIGDLDGAIARYTHALRLVPNYPEAHSNFGNALREQGKLDEAVARFTEALRLRPDYPDALNNLGLALQDQGKLDDAITRFGDALRIKSDSPTVLYNLGNALRAQSKLDDAINRYIEALQIKPDYLEAIINLGLALQAQDKLDDAIVRYTQALGINPDYAEARYNLGNVLKAQGKLDDAIVQYTEALRIKPDYPEALVNLGSALKGQGKLDAALAQYAEALRIKPNFPEGQWNESLARLMVGDFELGWRKYESRWKNNEVMPPHEHKQPLWDGSNLGGKSILIHCEQGFGDSIQFIRYAKFVKRAGGRVVVLCQPALMRLFQNVAGIDVLVSDVGQIPPCDYQVPLLSLPMILGTTLSTIPVDTPYLYPESDLVAAWRERFAMLPGLKVGMVWAGSPMLGNSLTNQVDRLRSMRLADFSPLADIPGITLISLQKGAPAAQIHDDSGGLRLLDLMDQINDFVETAALVANLDLVISVDTSVAHLVGAMAKPVWIMSRFDGCWRWLMDREDSPWYPTARLFRQNISGDWRGVVDRVATELRIQSQTLQRI